MKKATKLIDLYLWTLFFIAASSAVLRTIAIFTDFEYRKMQYESKLLITLSAVLVIFGIALLATYPILSERKLKLVAESTGAATYIPSGIVSAALLFTAFNAYVDYSRTQVGTTLPYLKLAIALLATFSAISLFVTVLIEKNESVIKAAFGIAMILFLATYATYLYFNRTVHPTNSPNKITDQMAYLFTAIFFVYETRIALGRAFWKPYITFGLIAALLNAYSAIPSIILYIANGTLISDSVYETVLTLTLFIFITSKILNTKQLSRDAECTAASKIAALAQIREDEISERRSSANAIKESEEAAVESDETVDMENYKIDIQMPPAEYYGITEDTNVD